MTETSHGPPAERVGVLVVRAWMEASDPRSLRVRVTRTFDVGSPLSEVSTATDVDEVCDLVRQWLREFRARGGSEAAGS